MSERKEAFFRVIVGIVSGIILEIWRWLIYVFILVNFVYTIFTGRRHREIADLSEIWNTQRYIFQRYIVFQSNRRPFPFGHLEKSISKHDLKPAKHFRKNK